MNIVCVGASKCVAALANVIINLPGVVAPRAPVKLSRGGVRAVRLFRCLAAAPKLFEACRTTSETMRYGWTSVRCGDYTKHPSLVCILL